MVDCVGYSINLPCCDIAFAGDINLISSLVQDLTRLLYSFENKAAQDGLEVVAPKCGHLMANGSGGPGHQLKTLNSEMSPVVTSQVHTWAHL